MKHEALCWVAVFLAKKVQSYLQTSFANSGLWAAALYFSQTSNFIARGFLQEYGEKLLIIR